MNKYYGENHKNNKQGLPAKKKQRAHDNWLKNE